MGDIFTDEASYLPDAPRAEGGGIVGEIIDDPTAGEPPGPVMPTYKTGWRIEADARDGRFLMREVVSDAGGRTSRYWDQPGYVADVTGWTDVAAAFSVYIDDGPGGAQTPPILDPDTLYTDARLLDSSDEDGTTMRSVCQVLQAAELIDSYWWAWDTDSVVGALLSIGPVLVGLPWFDSFWEPVGVHAWLRTNPSSQIVGGHCVGLYGVATRHEGDTQPYVMGKNVWGTSYGENGHFRISLRLLDYLFAQGAKACLPIPVGVWGSTGSGS